MSDHYLSNRRHFTLSAGLARLIGKPMLFSLTNGWAKFYQVDSHRKTAEIQGNSDPARMLSKLLIAWALTALCVIVHAMGMTVLLRWLRHSTARVAARFWFSTWLLVRVAGWIILLHLVEIAMWAFFYTWKHGMPDLQSALYFSAVTYTTTGYGDLLLPNEWRLIGGIEALTGILMCGWSAAFFFAVVSRMNQTRPKSEQT